MRPAPSLLSLPEGVLAHIARLLAPGQELLAVCKELRAVYHAHAAGAVVTRSYDYPADVAQLEILSRRCPALVRLDATAVGRWDVCWPLAGSLTQLTQLKVPVFWSYDCVPLTLRELVIPALHKSTELWDYNQSSDDWQDLLSTLAVLRDRSCLVKLPILQVDSDGPPYLNELLDNELDEHLHVEQLTVGVDDYDDAWAPSAAQSSRSFLSRLTRLGLEMIERSDHLQAWAALPCLQHLEIKGFCSEHLEVHSVFDVPFPMLTFLQLDDAPFTSLELTGTTGLRHLNIQSIFDLDVARKVVPLTHLAHLRCAVWDLETENLRALQGCKALTHLELHCHGRHRASDLATLKSLRSLTLEGAGALTDVRELGADLSTLTRLGVYTCSRLSSLVGLANASALLELDIRDCGALLSLSGTSDPHFCNLAKLTVWDSPMTALDLSVFPRLETCSVLRCERLTTCTHQAELPLLRSLHVVYCSALPCRLGCAPALARADFFQTPISGADGLSCGTRLTSLSLNQCPGLTSSADLPAAPLLEALTLICSEIPSLKHLRELAALSKLYLTGSQLEDLDGLQGAPQLRKLFLGKCPNLQSLHGLAPGVRDQLRLVTSECDQLRD